MKHTKFELKADGTIERVGAFGSYGPVVEAANKTEAATKFLAFAYRAVEKAPMVKIRNGAYQMAYESLGGGLTVVAGTEERASSLCLSGVSDWDQLTDDAASFNYYASQEYRNNSKAA